MDQLVWLRVSLVLTVLALCLAAWKWLPISSLDPREISHWLAPHRSAWYALPMVMAGFVALNFFPVLLLITATGIAFGPLFGPIYAMAGCLASGSVGFAIGRWLGRRRVEQLGGERVSRLSRAIQRNGTLAVFFVRKVPAPFTLANIVIGASGVRYRDFLVGTLLGMTAIVVALAGSGYQLTRAIHDPSPRTLVPAALFVAIPLSLALVLNRALRARAAE